MLHLMIDNCGHGNDALKPRLTLRPVSSGTLNTYPDSIIIAEGFNLEWLTKEQKYPLPFLQVGVSLEELKKLRDYLIDYCEKNAT